MLLGKGVSMRSDPWSLLLLLGLLVSLGCPESGNHDDDDDDTTGDDDSASMDDDDSAGDDDDSVTNDDIDGDGWSVEDGDCDDADMVANPGVGEICDGKDNDCDGEVDEECTDCHSEVSGPDQSIQDAISSYDESDEGPICVSPGTYQEHVNFRGVDVHVLAIAGAETTIIEGDGTRSVVRFDMAEGPGTILEGFTIRGGQAEKGGGIHMAGASPTLAKLIVEENAADEYGGGIYMASGSPVLVDVTIRDNTASWSGGGGLATVSASPLLAGLEVSGNFTYGKGGGIYLENSPGSLANSRIVGNESGQSGAGLHLLEADATIQRTVVEANHMYCTWGGGGGVSIVDSSPILDNVIVRANELTGYDWTAGAGLYISGSSPHIRHTWIIANVGRADYDDDNGGGLYISRSSLILENVFVVGNDLEGTPWFSGLADGSALFGSESTLELAHVSIVGNRGDTRTNAIYLEESEILFGSSVLAHNVGDCGMELEASSLVQWASDVFDNGAAEYVGTPDPTGTDTNISEAPLFLDETSADFAEWDLHLSAASPLVDAGDPSTSDPDGSPADIGAFGGPEAGGWDLDWDGYFGWWQPGEYDSDAYPGLGWDCDDQDGAVFPGQGC